MAECRCTRNTADFKSKVALAIRRLMCGISNKVLLFSLLF